MSKLSSSPDAQNVDGPALPGLDCGTCGFRTCAELSARLAAEPALLKRCLYLSDDRLAAASRTPAEAFKDSTAPSAFASYCQSRTAAASGVRPPDQFAIDEGSPTYRDSLGREIDFYLDHFPEDPGPREIIIPHNPMITREMDIQTGDILIGRPLGMSCGCPITHCGIARDVDKRTGVIVWCVTGPLDPRNKGFKDLGYYIAEGYEGLVKHTRREIRIGERYFFQPRMCMLQWRHSGLVNFLNRIPGCLQVRLEGLWIG